MTTEATHRAIAQVWADKVQNLEATVFRLQDELEVANQELHRIRLLFLDTMDGIAATCIDILEKIK